MRIENIEDDIKTRLAAQDWAANGGSEGQVKIIILPETDLDNERKSFKRGRLIVGFKNVEFEKTKSVSQVYQDGDVEVTITIESTKLRGEYSIYDFYNKVRKALLGYDPTDCGKMWMRSFGFVDYEAGIFVYEMCLAAPTAIVEDASPQTGPSITSINTNVTPTSG